VLHGVLVLASPVVLLVLALRVRAGMPLHVALLWAVLGIYALWAADLLFFPVFLDPRTREASTYLASGLGHWLNVVPFATIAPQVRSLSPGSLRQLGGNIGLLLPLGLIGPIVMPRLRRFEHLALVALGVSVSIELLQLVGTLMRFLERSADIDDVILNVTGAIVGWLMWRALSAAWGRMSRSSKDA
jgi:glycopeptide antibiotics resistance protein